MKSGKLKFLAKVMKLCAKTFFLIILKFRLKFNPLLKWWQVKVFDQCLDVLYQNLFFGAITLSFYEKKAGTKWYKICTTQISILKFFFGDLKKGAFESNLT